MSKARDFVENMRGVSSNIQTQITNKDSLPTQTGSTGKYLTTDGSTAAWDEVAGITQAKLITSGAMQHG